MISHVIIPSLLWEEKSFEYVISSSYVWIFNSQLDKEYVIKKMYICNIYLYEYKTEKAMEHKLYTKGNNQNKQQRH
jgi:hypothetical protein